MPRKTDQRSDQANRARTQAADDQGQRIAGATAHVGDAAEGLAETEGEQVEHLAQTMARAARDAAENARLLLTLTNVMAWRSRGLQQATSGFLDWAIRANAQAVQEWVRHTNPGEIAVFQQRFLREFLEAMTQCNVEMLRAAQQMAEQARRPLDRQAGTRREGVGRHRGARVSDVMSREVRTVRPEDTLQQAARLMGEADTGALPVTDNDRVLGILTDRDIAVRGVGAGKDPAKTPVREVMTDGIQYCYADEDLDHVAEFMADRQIHRVPVMDRQQHLVGIVSLGDLVERTSDQNAERALAGISHPTGQHSQQLTGR